MDLPLWRELAARAGGPVLDVGAGTGRVALDLAAPRARGRRARPRAPPLLAALRERARAAGCRSRPSRADARDFALGRRFALDRRADADRAAPRRRRRAARASCARAREHLAARRRCSPPRWPTRWRPSTPTTTTPRSPDLREVDGVRLRQPPDGDPRPRRPRRHRARPRGRGTRRHARRSATTSIELDRVDADELAAEAARARAARAGAARASRRRDEYVGSTVVMLRG